jgi:hypothetical protein
MSQCYRCHSHLGCAVDCSNAPWNWDLPTTNDFGHLRRLALWIRSNGGTSATIDRSSLHWIRHRPLFAACLPRVRGASQASAGDTL